MVPLGPEAVPPPCERESVLAKRMLLFVRFSAPRDRGTIMPSSLIPHIANLFLSSTVRLVNSATVMSLGHHFFIGSLIE